MEVWPQSALDQEAIVSQPIVIHKQLRDVRESVVTSKRIRRAVASRAAEGLPHGKIPYGYRRVYDPETRKLVAQEPDETTAPVVREIARRLLAGEATYAVAQDLNRRGIPAPRGGHWDLVQVKRLAIRPD